MLFALSSKGHFIKYYKKEYWEGFPGWNVLTAAVSGHRTPRVR